MKLVELVRCFAWEELILRIIENNEYTPIPRLVLVAFESAESFQFSLLFRKTFRVLADF